MTWAETVRRALAACTLALALAPAAEAAVINTTPGRLGSALSAAGPGDTVQLRSGVYTDVATVPAYSATVFMRPYPGERPILRNVQLKQGKNLHVSGFWSERLAAYNVDFLTLTNNDFTKSGVWLDFTDDLRFTGNRIHDSNDGLVLDDSSRFVVDRNECWNVPLPTREQSGDCVQMARTRNWTITKNFFHDQPAKPHVDAIEITDNNYDGVISKNRFRNVRGIVFTPGDATPNRSQYRMTVVNNLFAKTRSMAFAAVRMVDSRFVYNTAPDGGFVKWAGTSSGNVMVGNIINSFQIDVSRARTYLPVEDYNIMASVPSGYQKGANSQIGRATFKNVAAGDYRLAPGSRGINQGTFNYMPADDLLDILRSRPDIGAYAYTG